MRGRVEVRISWGMSGNEFAFSLSFVMHLQRVMSTYWDMDCILFTAFIVTWHWETREYVLVICNSARDLLLGYDVLVFLLEQMV
jgi:hypothetical protein